MKKYLIASIVALTVALVGASVNASFDRNLSVGSTGADVSALQDLLISKGFNIPAISAGTAKGYFGQQTKTAVIAYQGSVGLPTTGFVGPLTLAKLNAGGTVATVSTMTVPFPCPAGYTPPAPWVCPGTVTTPVVTTPGTVVTPGSITTPGIEGVLTVTQGAVSNSTVYEGQTMVPVLALQVKAQTSDLSVQRVQVDLGTNTTVYTKAFRTLYVMDDAGHVLATTPLNTVNVVKNGTRYVTSILGFNYIVPKDTTKNLIIAADLNPSIDSTYRTSWTFTLPVNGVRAVDGAGINQNAPSASIAQAVTIDSSLVDSASLKLSTNSATPANGAVIANAGSNNDQMDKVEVLVFNIKAEKDTVGITDLSASTTINAAGNNASTTSAYLYDGSTLISSSAVQSNGTVTFSNIGGSSGYLIAKDTTKAFTLKVDIRTAGATPGTLAATVLAANVSAINSQGSNVNTTGSASSNSLYVQKAGPVYTLVGTPSVSKSVIGQTSSSTFATGFTFDIAAQGTDVSLASTGAFVIGWYVNGAQVATTSATYAKPTTGVTGTNPYVIADGQSARFTAQTSFNGPAAPYLPAGGILTARLESVTWNTNKVSTYIADTFRAEPATPVTL